MRQDSVIQPIPVSVIIPSYNRACFLGEAIQSVLSQTVKPLEVIVVDDGSTDETRLLCQEKFPEVKYLFQENRGVSAARNLGMSESRGEWVALLDSDDIWEPKKLEIQWNYVQQNPDTKVVQTDEIWIRRGKRINPKKIHRKKSGWIFESCIPLCIISPSTVMIHRSVFEEVGTFDESLPACEDYDLWLRISLRYPVRSLPDKLITKRGGHTDQLSSQWGQDQYRIQALRKILKDPRLSEEQSVLVWADIERRSRIFQKGAEKRRPDYSEKFESFPKPLFENLDSTEQEFIRKAAHRYRFTFQEFRQVVEGCRDLAMWGEKGIAAWWPTAASDKKKILGGLREYLGQLRRMPKRYPDGEIAIERPTRKIRVAATNKEISGFCPVASEKTVCCNLRTIDAVEGCSFGCSYCSIQTFYSQEMIIDGRFSEKLGRIELDPNRFYHFGTGQASDSLLWGNHHGILASLCEFASKHPNILLEFKTKSKNVRFFLENEVPKNIVCSWSLNTPTIIQNEEHFTASLAERLSAARRLADRGIKVAFHFHPMVYYDSWREDYQKLARKVQDQFSADEVLFISFGSVTLIKPVIRKIRQLGNATKMLQMERVSDPHGKQTYSDSIKVEMFKTMHEAFHHWKGSVFMYLCMEKTSIWEETFGHAYANNEEFEKDFGSKALGKIQDTFQFGNRLRLKGLDA